jgi:PAS domain S-box-containing protein
LLEKFQEMNKGLEMSEVDTTEEFGPSETLLRRVIEGMPAWVQVSKLDGTIEMVNHAATLISGYGRSEMVGQTWPYPWLSAPWVPSEGTHDSNITPWPYAQIEQSGGTREFETTIVHRQGEPRGLAVTLSLLRDEKGRLQRVLMVGWDLTQRKAMEAELCQAQKIHAVSQLASGVAHEINNNLAVILGYSEFLLSASESFGDGIRQALSAIQEQSVECANTVRRIQLFSRSVPRSLFSSFSVNDVVREVIKQTELVWKDQPQQSGIDIRVETDLADLPPIYGYDAGLKEAFTSLVSNAVDALPQGGVISFKTRECGDEVVIEVRDNGVGIAPVHLNRIFDAFFTTKGPASSGLGLSIAYNLITQQEGKISVNSQEGKGTTFTIRLPYITGPVSNHVYQDQPARRRILSVPVVDDEPLVAEVFRTFLGAFGHRVVVCLSGANALEVFQQEDFDLALIDLGMPKMDGWEVARQMNQLRPDFPIIVATGWDVSLEDARDRRVRVNAILKKPFGMQELSQAIEQALG